MDFVAFDVETANQNRGSICSMGLVKVRNDIVLDSVNWLTQPPSNINEFDNFNIAIHGITAKKIVNAPSFNQRLEQFTDFIEDLPVISHNAAFDIGALREACLEEKLEWPTLTYGCTVVLSRRILKLVSNSLPSVCEDLGITFINHHDAQSDAMAVVEIVSRFGERTGTNSISELVAYADVILGSLDSNSWRGSTCVPQSYHSANRKPPHANLNADTNHFLYGKEIVFTGALSIPRKDAWQLAADLGAVPESSVTGSTNVLVIGDGFTGHDASEFQSAKAMKAVKLRAKGKDVEILNEQDFRTLVEERFTAGLRN